MLAPSSVRLKRCIHDQIDAGPRRTKFYRIVADSLRQTEGRPTPLRRSRAFAALLDEVDLVVLPDERIVGTTIGLWPVADTRLMRDEAMASGREALAEHRRQRRGRPDTGAVKRWTIMARVFTHGSVDYATLQHVAQTLHAEPSNSDDPLPYAELYHVLEGHFRFDYGEDQRLVSELPWFAANHLSLDTGQLLQHGFGGMVERVKRLHDKADADHREFYESVLISLEAAARFVRRYRDQLLVAAGRDDIDVDRSVELTNLADMFDSLAERPADSFHEALQLTWLLHVMTNLAGGSAISFGRFDQYLGPYLERDLAAGVIDESEARELLQHFWIKANEPPLRPVQSLCVGGLTADGRNGDNALTRLCLQAMADVQEPYPNTALRVHEGTDQALWETLAEATDAGNCLPMIYNDTVMLEGMARAGLPSDVAREYYPMGCVEIMFHGRQGPYPGAGTIMLPTRLELVFTNGQPNYAGECGPATGALSDFDTFDRFHRAFDEQVRAAAHAALDAAAKRITGPSSRYDPFVSAFIDGCLDRGVDVCQGGASVTNTITLDSMGLGTATDALLAIREAVYRHQWFTLEQMSQMLRGNFAGYEAERQMLSSRVPTFGNDDDEADAMAQGVYQSFVSAVESYPAPTGFVCMPQMFSYFSHIWRGEITDASANGRLRGRPFSDGVGPSQGRDVGGATRLLNSLSKLDQSHLIGGAALNLKLNRQWTRGESGRDALIALLKTYLANGGLQLQLNVLDPDVLRQAQVRPEEHRELVVRVGGFSEYFHKLDRQLQDEIIERSMQ